MVAAVRKPSQLNINRARTAIISVLKQYGPCTSLDLIDKTHRDISSVLEALVDPRKFYTFEDADGVLVYWLKGVPLPDDEAESVPVFDYTDKARAEHKRQRALVVRPCMALVVADHWTPAPVCAVCGQPARDGHTQGDKPLCADCHARALSYEYQRARRVDRLYERAERKQAESEAGWQRASDMASVIPMGQPILVGHHSEQRDRRYRARIWNTEAKAHEAGKDAKRLEDRAKAAEQNRAISSDDPLAVLKLEDKIADAERTHDTMKAANKAIRKHKKAGHEAQLAALVDLGFTEERAARLLEPDYLDRVGFPGYALSNNRQNIKRMERRVEELRAQAAHMNEPETTEAVQDMDGVDIVRSPDDNRLRLIFDGKPPATVRAILKRNGWRWSRANMAWQRHLNAASEGALERTLKQIKALDAAS